MADIPGGGQIRGNIPEEKAEGCAKLCSEEPTCCSFEYSPLLKICNLNTDCNPTLKKYLDYIFCTKVGEGKLTAVRAELFTNMGFNTQKWKLENGNLINLWNGGVLDNNLKVKVESDINGPPQQTGLWLDYNGNINLNHINKNIEGIKDID